MEDKMSMVEFVTVGQKCISQFQRGFLHKEELNPHIELSDEEYFLTYCTNEPTPDDIEQQMIMEERHG